MASPDSSSPPRSACPIAKVLDLLGDRWTLLVIRDLLFTGKRRFGELLGSPEGIPTNILTDRLRRLEEGGLVEKNPYQLRPPRYEYQLTAKGKDLLPALRALAEWSLRHLPASEAPSAEILETYKEKFRGLSAAPSNPEKP
jgi:DNA-binding HxlR family transcriptional regulator